MKQDIIKVLYITPGDIYGADQSLMTLLEELNGKVSPYVIMPHLFGLQNLLKERNIPYAKIRMRHCSVPKIRSFESLIFFPIKLFMAIRYNIFVSPKLKRIVRDFQPDVIHSNVGVFRIGHKISLQYRIPHIWHLREYQDKDMERWVLGKKRLKHLLKMENNYPIAITKGIADYFDVSHKQIVYNGILKKDELKFNPKKEKFFLFTGNVYTRKGVETLIEAFCKFTVHNDTYKLYIAGGVSNRYKRKLMKIIKKYKIGAEQVLFLGTKTKKEVAQLMSNATALVVSSYSEAFGRVVPEAMANGCLVIGNNTHGIKEQFDNGIEITGEEIGIRYDYSSEDLKNKMQEVVDHGIEFYYPLIFRSQQTVNKLYTVNEYGKKIYDKYSQFIVKSKP